MKKILFLLLISLLSILCLIQAQNKKTTGFFRDTNSVLDPGAGGDSLIIDFIEQMPTFPGGSEKLLKFMW